MTDPSLARKRTAEQEAEAEAEAAEEERKRKVKTHVSSTWPGTAHVSWHAGR
jgi:hypothetical protein